MKIEIRRSRWRQRYWVTVIAGNGEPLYHSENYANKADAFAVAGMIVRHGARAEIKDCT